MSVRITSEQINVVIMDMGQTDDTDLSMSDSTRMTARSRLATAAKEILVRYIIKRTDSVVARMPFATQLLYRLAVRTLINATLEMIEEFAKNWLGNNNENNN